MNIGERFKERVQKRVFDNLSSDATLKKVSGKVHNNRGELDSVTYEESDISFVPYNVTDKERVIHMFGKKDEGDLLAAIPPDVDISLDDKVVYEDSEWIVIEVRPQRVDNTTVANLVLFQKDDSSLTA